MTPLCPVVDDWPEVDREPWRAAQEPAGFLEPDKPASHWSPARRRNVEQAYGQWLSWLDRKGVLDPSRTPGERATEARLSDFVTELRARVAPVSAAMMLGALVRMLSALEPERDWGPLARVYNHLRQTAVPSRDKLSRLVRASDLFETRGAADGHLRGEVGSTRVRAHPLPRRPHHRAPDRLPDAPQDLTGLVIGQHLVFDGGVYRLKLSAAETKSGRPYLAAAPPELTPYIDDWLQVHRASLQLMATRKGQVGVGGHLWLNRYGQPMRSAAVRSQIELRTRRAFGTAIWPRLFRDCAVTELVDCAPEEIGIAPDLLGHADLRTTRKDYIQATGVTAHVRVQQMIAHRILEEYAAGRSPRAIAMQLNKEGVPGPDGRPWRDTAIRGHITRGTGILNNELYIGIRVWNRLQYRKDPATGRRRSRLNPPELWIIEQVPDLRIIDDELWAAVKARQRGIRESEGVTKARSARFWERRRAQHLLTGLVYCGSCGGRLASIGRDYLACSAARGQGTCTNRKGVRRSPLEELILQGLRQRLMAPELVEEFVAAYHEEVNRHRREATAARAGKERELAEVTRKLDKLIEALIEGYRTAGLQQKLEELEARKAALEQALAADPPPPVRLQARFRDGEPITAAEDQAAA